MSGVLRISEAASLAVHAAVFLAGNGHVPLSNKEIASALGVSASHLSKVLRTLSRAGLLRSSRGPLGGFVLKKPPDEISLLEVFESVEGPLSGRVCLLPEQVCDGLRCLFGDFLKTVTPSMKDYLGHTMLSDVKDIPRSRAIA